MRIRSSYLLALLFGAIFATPSASQVVLSHSTIHVLTAEESTAIIAATKKATDDVTNAKAQVAVLDSILTAGMAGNSLTTIEIARKNLALAETNLLHADSILDADTKRKLDRSSTTDWQLETFRMGATGGLETKDGLEVPSDPSVGLIFEYNPFWNVFNKNKLLGILPVRRITGYISINTSAGQDTLGIDKTSIQSLVLPGSPNTLANIGVEIAFGIDKFGNKDTDLNDMTLFLEFAQSKYAVRDTDPNAPKVHEFSARAVEIGIRWDGTALVSNSSYGVFSIGGFLRGFWVDQSGKDGFVGLNSAFNITDVPTGFHGQGLLAKARFNKFGVEFRWVNMHVLGKGKKFNTEIPGITGGIFSLQTTFTGDIFGG